MQSCFYAYHKSKIMSPNPNSKFISIILKIQLTTVWLLPQQSVKLKDNRNFGLPNVRKIMNPLCDLCAPVLLLLFLVWFTLSRKQRDLEGLPIFPDFRHNHVHTRNPTFSFLFLTFNRRSQEKEIRCSPVPTFDPII